MENKPDDVPPEPVVSKWRKLVRQQSEKLVTLADNVVLPMNERLARLASRKEDMEMQNFDEEHPQSPKVITEKQITRKKVEHFPIFMIGISILQIIIYYCFDTDVLRIKLGYDPHRRHEIWRFFTMMLVHGSYTHLWRILVMQLVVGVFIEIVHEWKRMAIIYLASVLGGSLCITALDNTSYSVGASGAVMGLWFSHLATIILNWREMDRKISRLFCILLYVVFDVGTDIYLQFVEGYALSISFAARFGGALTGFLVSILVLKNFKKRPWEDTLQKICVGILTGIFVIVFVMNVTLRDYYPSNEWNFDYQKRDFGDYETIDIDTIENTTPYDYYDWNIGKI